MKTKNIGKLILTIIICQIAGVIGSIFTSPAIPEWYARIQKHLLGSLTIDLRVLITSR